MRGEAVESVSIEKHLEKVENKNRIIIEGGPGGQGKFDLFLSNRGYDSKGEISDTGEGGEICRSKVFE